MTNLTWLAQEAHTVHDVFYSFFYILVTTLLVIGVASEYIKIPLGQMPGFAQLVGRVFVAAILLHAYPDITNAIADLTDALATRLGDLNQFKLVLDRMGDKLGELSWSWVSVKDTVMLVISFLTFFLLYFSVHIAGAFYLYTWTMLYVFSPLLIALFILPVTAQATSALFRSLIEVACWKIVWSVTATILWSAALSDINKAGMQVSFLTAISFNVILAGSLLLTPFLVHALAGSGLSNMSKGVGALAIGGLAMSPGTAINMGKKIGSRTLKMGTDKHQKFRQKFQDTHKKNQPSRADRYTSKTKTIPAKSQDQNDISGV